eukprot:s680_g12.t1
MQGVKWTEPKMSNVPGLTRDVSFFQLSNHPRLYCYDTPGVSLLKRRNDPERNAKLGVLKLDSDCLGGSYKKLGRNRDHIMDYVRELELPGPTNDIRYLCAHISALLAHRNNNQVYTAQVGAGATFFLDLWRAGKLGKVCLDYVPDPDEVERLRRLRAQTEPPGPWGPACYPDVPDGLELSRRGPLLPEGFVAAGRHGLRSAAREFESKGQLEEALDGYNRAVAVLKLVYNFDPRSKNPKIKEMVATRIAELEGCARRLDPGQPGPPTSSAGP